ncbi:MAG: hypothetical protein HC906_06735 [Bacteroidales bacterium]|nr:hypothetical protein [Bacteroidales bacterium]
MLKNIKSLFIVSDEEEKPSQETAQTAKVEPKPSVPPAPKGNIDHAILDKLFQALENNNQQGFDYLEFRKALQTLNALPMEEATKFQSAFATASTIGVTLDKLISSIEFYKKVLASEEENFNKAIKEQTTVNIENRNAEKDKISALIKEKSEKIQKLTEEIRAHQNELTQLNSFIESAELKIKETSLNFETSLNIIKNQLSQDADKLKQYIK